MPCLHDHAGKCLTHTLRPAFPLTFPTAFPPALAPALAAALLLAGCGSGDQETEAQMTGPAADMAAPVDASLADGTAAIPASIQGNWGMTPADCDPGMGDAQGMLNISATSLEFFESEGQLDSIVERRANGIRAHFAFTGEGMSWQRKMSLDVQEADQVLIRSDYGEDAAAGPLRYARCN